MKQMIQQYVMVVLLIVGAYFLGVYKTKTEFLEKGAGTATPQTAQQQQQAEPTSVDFAKVKNLFDDKHITFGDKDAKLVFTEISDPSCPFCHIAGGLHPELNDTSAQFKMKKNGGNYEPPVPEIRRMVDDGKASFLFLYSNGHGNGEVGTQLLYCAYDQGKFWQVHDKLMSKEGYDMMNDQVRNDITKAGQLIKMIGSAADGRKLQACLDSKKYATRPSEDMAMVQSLTGGSGTPTFFVNDKIVSGAQSWTAFAPLITQ